MDLAYSLADVIISRAGAGTISELCLVGKPVILVPSPNVAEDHQTKNAMALVQQQAALMIADRDAHEKLLDTALRLVGDEDHENNPESALQSDGHSGFGIKDRGRNI